MGRIVPILPFQVVSIYSASSDRTSHCSISIGDVKTGQFIFDLIRIRLELAPRHIEIPIAGFHHGV